MSVQKIIQEAINKNPLALKEALEEELRSRVALALEAKVSESEHEYDEDEDDEDLDEAFAEGDHVHFKDEYGDKIHGHITKPFSVKKMGAKHAEVKLAGGMGTKMHVPHGQLKKVNEELEDFMMSEDFDQLDELDKKTLASYVKKASRSADKSFSNSIKQQGIANRTGSAAADQKRAQHSKDFDKRATGIDRANSRLANEDFDLSDLTLEELEDFMMSEDFDQLDELDKKTLASYVKKASRSADKLSKSADKYSDKAYMAGMDSMAGSGGGHKALDRATKYYNRAAADSKKAANRTQGVARANSRLTKEEVEQLDELSPKTLGSYVKKAGSQASKDFDTYGAQKRKSSRLASRAMASGEKTGAGMQYDKEADDAMNKANAAMKRYDKRATGIGRAKDRLAK